MEDAGTKGEGKNMMAWDLIAAPITLTGMWLTGKKLWYGWVICLCAQVLWFVWALSYRSWGLLALTVIFAVIHVKNAIAWRKEEVASKRR